MSRAIGTWSGGYKLQDMATPRGGSLLSRLFRWFVWGPLWLYTPDPDNPMAYTSKDGKRYTIALTMDTDGATIPRFLWGIPGMSPWDWSRAALLHDALWAARLEGQLRVSFWRSNRLLQEGIEALGWSRWFALLIFWLVTLLGWVWWIGGEVGIEE